MASDVRAKPPWDSRPRRWVIWLTYLAVWTIGLLLPLGDSSELGELQQSLRFYVGKTLHIVGYAGLTALGGWLGVAFPRRLLVLFFVMTHAVLSEILQPLLSNRTGLLSDVCLDHLGIALGLLLTWNWWSAPAGAGGNVR
jgi:VanZ family protein